MCRSDLTEEIKDDLVSAKPAEESAEAWQSEAANAATAAAHRDRGEGFVEDYMEERRQSSTSDAVSTSSRDDGDVRWRPLLSILTLVNSI